MSAHGNDGGTLRPVRKLPYPDETWEEVADHQLDHDKTPAQIALYKAVTEGYSDRQEFIRINNEARARLERQTGMSLPGWMTEGETQ